MELNILFEDNHIIVVEKPPKVPSQQDKTNDLDLLTMIKEHIKKEHPQVKEPYIALIHRLDRPVGGVMVYGKTKFASGKLSEQIQKKQMTKKYIGVVCGIPKDKMGELKNHLVKISVKNYSKVVPNKQNNSKEAILEYKVIESCQDDKGILSLLEFNLITGRHHQIRVQTAHAGWPLWGDTKYNNEFKDNKEWTQVALWAKELSFNHPKTNKPLTFESMPTKEYPFNLFKNT
ncbi:ribosomal large subunit pseudouridine synthase D [Natranaerovirga pectinivora]|uniref:RNA pseudouridylate synthase n=1 Tax=Natranaerovirga pectinivora TaxID=682400 RepID=A0A4R3MK26_9FIRM|nr:RluA family pseudouridine synthase [Natranaerovirga pectinivora]TCT13000.1 ribosomal large subunit pseudouridine synthase D [Natranaerovirga pectinivora]